MKANGEIKEYAKSKGVKLWQVAECLLIQDSALSRKLRHELPDAEKERIRGIIDRLTQEVNTDA